MYLVELISNHQYLERLYEGILLIHPGRGKDKKILPKKDKQIRANNR
jgi:hypothetical protein